jgi:hypothetical protein
MAVTQPVINDGASKFLGNGTFSKLMLRSVADVASLSSSGVSRRQYPQTFVADILACVFIAVMK